MVPVLALVVLDRVAGQRTSHAEIMLGYVAAMVLLPSSLRSLIKINWWTFWAGAGFFVLCATTHIALLVGHPYGRLVTATDQLQALAIWVFVVGLVSDVKGALQRFGAVLDEVERPTVGRRIGAALQDKPGWDDPVAWSEAQSRRAAR